MNTKLELAQSFYFTFRRSVDEGQITEEIFEALINNNPDIYKLTEYELREAKPEFKEFIKKHNFLVTALDKYGYTDPYGDFIYSYDRLNLHLVKMNMQKF